MTRRTLCIGVGATVAMAGLGALRYVGSEPLVRPPGGQDEENLVSRCVHCYRCIEACPEKVIVAASLDAGVLNTETCIAYRSSFCAFCHDVCIQVRGEENAAIYYQNADAADALDTRLPVVDAEKCNGCGACEAVCVSAQAGSTMNASERAIVVKPLEG